MPVTDSEADLAASAPGAATTTVESETDAGARRREAVEGLPRRRWRPWTLRAHLVTIVVTAAVLLLATGVEMSIDDFREARAAAQQTVRLQSRIAAQEIADDIPELRSLLVRSGNAIGVAAAGNLPALAAERCALNFTQYRVFTTGVLQIVLPEGNVLCASSGTPADQAAKPYANAPWLKRVLDAGRPAVEGPLRDEATGRWSLFVAAPIPDQARTVGALALVLHLEDLAPALARRFNGPRAIEYLLTDGSGVRVASRSLQPARWSGAEIGGRRFTRANTASGATLSDLNGDARFYAGSRVADLGWHVYAGIAKHRAEAPARAALVERAQVSVLILVVLAAVTLSGMVIVKRR